MKRRERGGGDAAGFAFETLSDEPFELGGIEIEHPRHEPKRENIFAFVLRRAADGLDGQLGDGHAHVAVLLQQRLVWLHVAAVVQNDAAFF